MGVTETRLAQFIVQTSDSQIPSDAISWAKKGSYDCIGVMLAGVASPPGKVFTRFARELGGPPEITAVGTGMRLPLLLGTLINGGLAHALDFDDMGSGWGHPSCVLLPPLVSLGERFGASGMDVLNAYAIGFEVGSAITAGCPHYVQQERGFHGTSIFGTLVAAAACARLLRLNESQTLMALGVAASLAGAGIVQNFGSYTKGLHAGHADQNAATACLMAKNGLVATDKFLESKAGFLHAHAGKDMYDLNIIRESLGKWRLSKGLTIKKYPCCGAIHPSLDAILPLINENKVKLEDIERVDLYGMPGGHHILLYPEPTDSFQGKFSLYYSVATAMIDGKVNIDSYAPEKLARPEFRQALDKLDVHIMTVWDPNYTPGPVENPIVIKLKDGTTLRKSVNRQYVRGTPANPLKDEEIISKFKANAALALHGEAVAAASDTWWDLEKMPDVRDGLKLVAG